MIRTTAFFCMTIIFLMACSGKSKKKMSGEETITVVDFIEFFDDITLPQQLNDSILSKKNSDSTFISYPVFKQFVPDSLLMPLYDTARPKIYALGKFRNKEEETYLLIKTKGGKPAVNAVYALAFTPKNEYSAGLQLLSDSKKANEINVVNIDKGYTFTLVDQYKDAGGNAQEFSAVYVYNNAGLFMMIMKNGLQKGELKAIINPIDSLPATHKFSGNYVKDERNFITVRDGKTADELLFYINFDKGPASNCQAELKGTAYFVGKDTAYYHEKSDPCTIGFKFGTNSIRITEMMVCGNQRPAECSFNASYTRKKEKAKTEEKKKQKK